MKRIVPLLVVVLVLAGGCASSKPTPSEQARKQWNSARAGVMVGLARQQLQTGDLENCRKTLAEAEKLDPENPNLHLLSARAWIEQGKLEQAENELQTVRRLDPKSAEACYLSGVIYQRWQRPQVALEMYAKAAELQPAELAYQLARAEMLVWLDRPAEALALLQEKVAYFENSAAIRDAVGQLLVQQGNFAQGAQVLRQAQVLAPEDPVIREHLAMALYYAGQYADAQRLLAKMTQEERFSRRGDLLEALGHCQMQLRQPVEARQSFEAAAGLDPGNAGLWLNLAKAAMETNDLRRAELSLLKATHLEPARAESQLLLGYLRLRQNRLDDALLAFSKASALQPTDTVALCMVGRVLEKKGKAAAAMECYAKALRLKPGDELASKLMAQVQINE